MIQIEKTITIQSYYKKFSPEEDELIDYLQRLLYEGASFEESGFKIYVVEHSHAGMPGHSDLDEITHIFKLEGRKN